jgi:hypothetical protein
LPEQKSAAGRDADMDDHYRHIIAGLYALWIVAMALIAVAFMAFLS